jgi:hypothetical protein
LADRRPPTPLSLKPNIEDTARRWEAYYNGDIIDRPIVIVTAPLPGDDPLPPAPSYRQRAMADIDSVIDAALVRAERTYYGGESVPCFMPSFGPDECAVFCGAELTWSNDSGDTNWSVPCVSDWESVLPLRLHTESPIWQRMVAIYRSAAERLAGKMLLMEPDLHTNMDLLAALRGPQQLCLDLIDMPETIDRAMMSARAIFPELWRAVTEAGKMYERGFYHSMYSTEGCAMLQCDFSAMIGPAMFRRWVLPALEEEAEIVHDVYYHWDGPDALKHLPDLVASKGLYTLAYVVGDGHGRHTDYLHITKKCQEGGKAVSVYGTPEELKIMHRELRPEKTLYHTWVESPAEADALLEWFVKNT